MQIVVSHQSHVESFAVVDRLPNTILLSCSCFCLQLGGRSQSPEFEKGMAHRVVLWDLLHPRHPRRHLGVLAEVVTVQGLDLVELAVEADVRQGGGVTTTKVLSGSAVPHQTPELEDEQCVVHHPVRPPLPLLVDLHWGATHQRRHLRPEEIICDGPQAGVMPVEPLIHLGPGLGRCGVQVRPLTQVGKDGDSGRGQRCRSLGG
jgi:hypothetical protein